MPHPVMSRPTLRVGIRRAALPAHLTGAQPQCDPESARAPPNERDPNKNSTRAQPGECDPKKNLR